MAGISSLLNIAKQALLAQQVAMEVSGNNVANVDTPGYTRQALVLTPSLSSPSPVGPIGNGVDAEYIQRFYDQFTTSRIMQATSDKGNADAQANAIQQIQTTFNEVSGLGLNDLMSQFWTAWQNLADNPELESSRQGVVQQASQLADQFQSMTSQINTTRDDIGVNLDSGVKSINNLTQQIAELNTQITATETGKTKANALRDQRDTLLQQLSQLVNVNYFETSDGAYTVLLQDGHPLVEKGQSWQVDWSDNSLQWVSTKLDENNQPVEVKTDISSETNLGGEMGGWLATYNSLDPQNPDSIAGKLNSLAYSFIREVNQQVSQGVGLQAFSGTLTGTETDSNTAILTGLVDASTANQTIPDGTFTINDRAVGEIDGGATVNGLAMTKAANTVTAINNANTGVNARLTTLVAGDAVTGMAASAVGSDVSMSVSGVNVDYTVQAGDTAPATFAQNMVDAINAAITANNVDPTNGPALTIEAEVGDGTNGGAVNSIVLKNTNAGDESDIVLDGIDKTGIEANLGLTNGTYNADQTHNTGEVTLFSTTPFTVKAGYDDSWLAQYGWDGGNVSSTDVANDGQFTYTESDDTVPSSTLMGYSFANALQTNGGSFQMWIYNTDGTLALGQPVTVSLDRAYNLEDVADDINHAITTASGKATPYVQATVNSQNQLVLTPDGSHTFAFANDTSNILQVAGLNTLFTGDSAGDIGVNSVVANDPSLVTAGTVNDSGDILQGDNSNALKVTNIQGNENVEFEGQPDNTLDGFYNALVGDIGEQGQAIQQDQQVQQQLSTQLSQLRDSTSGVSLDEEMSNLIQYQQAYTAAAKMITMSDDMLQTLLQAVQG